MQVLENLGSGNHSGVRLERVLGTWNIPFSRFLTRRRVDKLHKNTAT